MSREERPYAIALGICLLLIAGLVALIILSQPRDSQGNPLPCVKHKEGTYFQYTYDGSGNVTGMYPVNYTYCSEYATETPPRVEH